MDIRLALLIGFMLVASIALPSDAIRSRRDVMESMKSAWSDMVKSLSDAGDAVVHVFKPTEKSTIDKILQGIRKLGE